jgi:dephospho-CoA kinase
MLVVGLTGSIGMGKSTAAARFRDHGVAVFDADAEVHRLYDGPLAAAVEGAFPGVTVNGRVDRAELSRALLAEPAGFKRLEALVHPAVRAAERAFLQSEYGRGAKIAVLEVPLLFEGGGDALVDAVVVVSAEGDVQRRRVLSRSGMTDQKLARLLQRQTPDADKRQRADFVVDTSGSVADCDAQIDAILPMLANHRAEAYAAHWQ